MLSTNEIIKRIKKGDDSIMLYLYKTYRNDFIKWALFSFKCEEEDVKDIFQEIIISFYLNVRNKGLNSIDNNLKTYLFSCGKNHLLNLSKKNQKFINLIDFEFTNDDMNEIERLEKSHHDKAVIEEALKVLPEECQKIIKLYYFDNYDLESIARELGYKNANVVKTKKSDSMKKLVVAIKKVSNKIKILV